MTALTILGTGTIGFPVARHIAQAGYDVTAWNRTRDKADPLSEHGVRIADDPAGAAEGAEIVMTVLTDADTVLEVAERALPETVLWIQLSTIGIEGTERVARLADDRGAVLLDAPVLGTKQPAEAGQLTVLASGPEDARERCRPIFDAIGQKTLWLGEAGAGTRLKLVVNNWLLALVEGLAETIALAEGLGVDPRSFLDLIDGGPLNAPYAQTKGAMMIKREFPAAFRLALARKDARIVAEAAERHGLDLPLPKLVADRMGQAEAAGHGDEDMAATILAAEAGGS
jgi:3-hydroxyisobutyrate dehydrogenase